MSGYRCRLCGQAQPTIDALIEHLAGHPDSALAHTQRLLDVIERDGVARLPPPPEATPCCAHTHLEARVARRAVRASLRAEKRHRRGARQKRSLWRKARH